MFPSAFATDTHRPTYAPQMSSTGTEKGQGTPSPSPALYVCVHGYILTHVSVYGKWEIVAKYPHGGVPDSWLWLKISQRNQRLGGYRFAKGFV